MDIQTLRVMYPTYNDDQLEVVASIYDDAAPIQARIDAMPASFARTSAQQSLTQTLQMLANNVPAE